MARIGRFVGVLEGDLALLGGELYHCLMAGRDDPEVPCPREAMIADHLGLRGPVWTDDLRGQLAGVGEQKREGSTLQAQAPEASLAARSGAGAHETGAWSQGTDHAER